MTSCLNWLIVGIDRCLTLTITGGFISGRVSLHLSGLSICNMVPVLGEPVSSSPETLPFAPNPRKHHFSKPVCTLGVCLFFFCLKLLFSNVFWGNGQVPLRDWHWLCETLLVHIVVISVECRMLALCFVNCCAKAFNSLFGSSFHYYFAHPFITSLYSGLWVSGMWYSHICF